MAEYGDMDGLPEGYPVKVIITERDKSRHSFSGQTNDDRYGESRTLISCSIPPTDVMETLMPTAAKPAINEFDGKILQDQAGTAFARETDTRSVTFDSTQYTGHELVDNDDGPERPAPSRRDLCSSELCTSNETLGIDKEIARRNAEATEDILTSGGYSCETNTSGTDFYTIELQRARTNTPTSTYCTDITESKSATKNSHPSDDGTSKSDIYNTAMTLMTERCSSTAARNRPSCGSAVSDKQSFGLQTPEYFYVEQTKPSPMTPLQAWRGYHGNVYFEPIKVQPARYSTPEQQEMPLEKCSDQLRDILKRSRRVQSSRSVPIAPVAGHEFVSIRPLARSMTNLGRNSARSNSSSQHRQAGYRKMAVLDKRMVFSENNENIHEDIIWIVGQESTGSLLLQNELAETEPNQPSNNRTASRLRHQRQQNAIKQRQPVAAQPKKGSLDRERICRGSVVRRSHPQRSGANRPGAPSVLFAVTGARLAQQQLQSSPLLRTQTQYSHSNQRCLNSPDLFSGLDRLPPLEQLRASLRHIEPDRRANPTHIIPPLDRIKFEDAESMTKDKPFVKYSVEVTNTARLRNGQISRRQQKVM